jgi:nicotinate-nucleotide pyrophosphorylase
MAGKTIVKYGIWIKDPDLKMIEIEADSPEEAMKKALAMDITLADSRDYHQIVAKINKRKQSCN